MALPIKKPPRKTHHPYPVLACPRCVARLSAAVLRSGDVRCQACGETFLAEVFPLPDEKCVVKPLAGSLDGAPAAPCALHAGNAASGNCERCGNFICGLCATELAGKSYCTACFERLAEEGGGKIVPRRSWNLAGIAALCAAVGMLGPLVVVLSWKSIAQVRREGLRGGRIRESVMLLLLGVVETLSLVVLIVSLIVLATKESK